MCAELAKPQFHIVTGQNNRERNSRIIKNYGHCVGLLDQLSYLLFNEICGPCIDGHGFGYLDIGCCHKGHRLHEGMHSPAEDEIYSIWDKVLREALDEGRKVGGQRYSYLPPLSTCRYLEMEKGCILGNLKPMVCAKELCITPQIEERYNIRYDKGMIEIGLRSVLEDERTDSSGRVVEGINPNVVQNFKNYIRYMINSIKMVKQNETAVLNV